MLSLNGTLNVLGYDGVALSQVHSKYLQMLGRVEFSPLTLCCFTDSVISKLRAAGLGTRIGHFFFGCLLYADDILRDLQAMLDFCAKEAVDLDFIFNVKTSVVLRIGPRYNYACVPLTLSLPSVL